MVTLSAKDNQKLSKPRSKGFETSMYWNEYQTKSENKITTNEYRYFLQSNFAGVNRLFFWFIQTQLMMQKGICQKIFFTQRVLSKIITSSSTEITFIKDVKLLEKQELN